MKPKPGQIWYRKDNQGFMIVQILEENKGLVLASDFSSRKAGTFVGTSCPKNITLFSLFNDAWKQLSK